MQEEDANFQLGRGEIPSFYTNLMWKTVKKIVELFIFSCRWLLIIALVKLIVTLCVLVGDFFIRGDLGTLDTIKVLQDVDVLMLANLVKSIITGSYNSFIAKDHGYANENVSSGILKVKMGSSLVGISSIYLLKVFLSLDKNAQWNMIWMLIAIHCTFLLSTLILATVEYLHSKSEREEQKEPVVIKT